MKRTTAAVLASLVSALAAPAFCAWQDLPATDFTVAPPPAPRSAADVADFNQLMDMQNNTRTKADCALAQTMPSPDFESLFGGSGLLTPAQMTAVGPLLDRVTQLGSTISGDFKQEYHRPRPYNENSEIKPCADKPKGATSYPSTHATNAALDACVLGRLFPSEADQLASYGKHLGNLRAIVGVHHPTDVAAGQDLAGQICKELLAQDDFLAELAKVKASLTSP